MIKDVLERVGGIENFGILSILLFFACFLAVLLWVLCLKKNYLNQMSRLPLEDDDSTAADAGSVTNQTPSPRQP